MTDFYPAGYAPKENLSDYMKLDKEGDYRIRILTRPIIGYQTWEDGMNESGQKTSIPHRSKTFQEGVNLPSRDGKVAEFHAFIVWDYQSSMVRLLNVTQRGIKEPIYNYAIDEDWGDPTRYDLVIKRTGLTLNDTKYSVIAKPAKPMSDEIVKAFKAVKIDPELYFEGGHPIIRETNENDGGESIITSEDLADQIPF
jgi:hypothetical protein